MMKWTNDQLWQRFKKYYRPYPKLHLALDLSRMNFGDDYFATMDSPIRRAMAAMLDLEKGAIANPDEGRMVGHYWLRDSGLAPNATDTQAIEKTLKDISAFADKVHRGEIHGATGPFKNLLIIGIGGSALGPKFVAEALGDPVKDKLKLWFLDNTDPDGIDKVIKSLEPHLGQTLCLVISKSGKTKETRNGMLETQAAYSRANLKFNEHATAITKLDDDSELYGTAQKENWLKPIFPMWDWVGGRTSETSAVGLLPAALQGINIEELLAGARACDAETRDVNVNVNPSALLALMWYYAGNGKGDKDMVILPYKDRLELFSRYLQQLIMESLGKEVFLNGEMAHQGIAVYGNKGSTDQHAYVQQLRDGINNFFVTFIEVLKDREGSSIRVDRDEKTGQPLDVTSGDYLNGYLHGTRRALHDNGRESITITVNEISPFSIGVLIALYERAVGLYASLINLNAYHQPGVEAGKKAAENLIHLQLAILKCLENAAGKEMTLEQISKGIQASNEVESIFKILEHLTVNPERGIDKMPGTTPFSAKYKKR